MSLFVQIAFDAKSLMKSTIVLVEGSDPKVGMIDSIVLEENPTGMRAHVVGR